MACGFPHASSISVVVVGTPVLGDHRFSGVSHLPWAGLPRYLAWCGNTLSPAGFRRGALAFSSKRSVASLDLERATQRARDLCQMGEDSLGSVRGGAVYFCR